MIAGDGHLAWGELWLDHDKIGCGWRHVVALPGRKWVRVIELATGFSARVSLAEYLAAVKVAAERRPPCRLKPARVAKALRRNAAAYGRADALAVKDALAALRATTRKP